MISLPINVSLNCRQREILTGLDFLLRCGLLNLTLIIWCKFFLSIFLHDFLHSTLGYCCSVDWMINIACQLCFSILALLIEWFTCLISFRSFNRFDFPPIFHREEDTNPDEIRVSIIFMSDEPLCWWMFFSHFWGINC